MVRPNIPTLMSDLTLNRVCLHRTLPVEIAEWVIVSGGAPNHQRNGEFHAGNDTSG
jgi:hypothetical protein